MRPRLVLLAAIVVIALCLIAVMAGTADGSRSGCNSNACELRVQHKQIIEHRREVVRPYLAWLARLRACESGGNYKIVNRSGTYTGAYQFDDQTWRSVGGKGRAMHAGKLEQDYRAVRLRQTRGTAPWPACG